MIEYTVAQAEIDEVKKNLEEAQKERQKVAAYLSEIDTVIQRQLGILMFFEEKNKAQENAE